MVQMQAALRRRDGEMDETIVSIAAFMARATFETTRLGPDDAGALRAHAAPGTPVYVSALPAKPFADQRAVVEAVRAAGFEPVPHLAVRSVASIAALSDHLGRMVERAGVSRVLVIGGDRSEAAGPFRAAVELIESGLLQSLGIREVGIAGYPDGHPRLAPIALERALAAKLAAAGETGLAAHIVTQFTVAADPVVGWLARLRAEGIDHPVRVGFAGPASVAALLRYAKICGVRASAQGLARNVGLARDMLGRAAPDRVVRGVAAACRRAADGDGGFGEVTPHLYAFGGLAAAVRWAAAVAAGRIALDGGGGFAVMPP
ncbi:methylenetetrahydrofolate reductase [Rhodoplanes sp. TEM]|uniref:Methylenetetrahydrofolate reductase n=1 Tax=Rhodoplanes tepidamans TaxID=200616 RepID=A0ABT5JJB7_RHOTP|nr:MULTISPECIES: methylenetetrahydrofolate reductase [Rhodoplanes]MDC7789468.1 methylenetetrahydrofolate reductase [Rhodoplanes tepidamans]MDC7986985.1 methylenetetrahydrofolate reductase [Rhodoplanes sp. TEM]MDQ0359017.1 methylenetetrahydrofolate reductase (NADPH) [Rhodoplanes tepidamans]